MVNFRFFRTFSWAVKILFLLVILSSCKSSGNGGGYTGADVKGGPICPGGDCPSYPGYFQWECVDFADWSKEIQIFKRFDGGSDAVFARWSITPGEAATMISVETFSSTKTELDDILRYTADYDFDLRIDLSKISATQKAPALFTLSQAPWIYTDLELNCKKIAE